ncbi:pyruvate kinase [Caldiplasma sukawensis]
MEIKRTAGIKIVATYGPSCSDENVLEAMVNSGVSCLRLNTAHSSMEDVKKLSVLRENIFRKTKKLISIMIDLKGPEMRALPRNDNLNVQEGKIYHIGKGGDIETSLGKIEEIVKKDDRILFSDGAIQTVVTGVESDHVDIMALNSGDIKKNARLNIPGRFVPLGILQDRDKKYLDLAIENMVEYVALSFVQSREEIDQVNDLILSKGGSLKIISKIETQQAMKNLNEIVRASDALMVARGDLGVEMPLYEVALSQKKIISASHNRGIPAIVATQMLESMVNRNTPTRAEVSDITNAILDDADALMLSEETAVGKFPLDVIRTMRETAEYVESNYYDYPEPENFNGSRITFSIARSARVLARESKAHRVIVLTKTGNTARMVSAARPGTEIVCVTGSKMTAGQISIYRDVKPFLLKKDIDGYTIDNIIKELMDESIIVKGERLVITSGYTGRLFAGTSQLAVTLAGTMIARGYGWGDKVISGVKWEEGKNGEIFFGKDTALSSVPQWEKKFKGFVFTGRTRREITNKLQELNIPYISNTTVFQEPQSGGEIIMDTEIGAVYI